MRGAGVITFVILGYLSVPSTQFLNNRPHPTYSMENMPDTVFSCREKVLGGYYADLDTQCQMFHVCVKVAGIGVQDFRFLCPNGTAFDQDHQICADWDDVDCDASTLYYSSDTFDLYRIGSGFESKAVKYGEEEEVFGLQRAETGDIRLNKEKETQRVNQQPEPRPFRKTTQKPQVRNNNNHRSNSDNNDRDIFKGSSSGHYFNNRNNGKENDEDYDDGSYNANQNEDRFQTRKVNRKPVRNQYNNNNNNNNQYDAITPSTRRPTGFVNNFAGSSYVPTTSRPSTTTPSVNRQSIQYNNQHQNNHQNNNNNYNTSPSQYTVSTPSPFRQTQQYNNNNNNAYRRTTPTKQDETYTENYSKQKITNAPTTVTQKYYNTQYRTKTTESETYSPTTRFENQKQKQPKKVESTATTYIPKNNVQQQKNTPSNSQTPFENLPTTFSPRTNAGFSQLNQQTTTLQHQQSQNKNISVTPTQYTPQNYYNRQPANANTQSLNQKPQTTTQQQSQTPQLTQFTPTVPKVTTKLYTTTQQPRFSNRYDETQYDDNASDSREEFLSAAHSTNIANSRNELQKTQKTSAPTTTQKPRPFSLTTSKYVTQVTSTPPPPPQPKRKPKDYDYAYYDTNVSDAVDYDVHTDIKKADKKQ